MNFKVRQTTINADKSKHLILILKHAYSITLKDCLALQSALHINKKSSGRSGLAYIFCNGFAFFMQFKVYAGRGCIISIVYIGVHPFFELY